MVYCLLTTDNYSYQSFYSMYLFASLACYFSQLFMTRFTNPSLRLTPALMSLILLFYLTRYTLYLSPELKTLLTTLTFSLCLTLHAHLVSTFNGYFDHMKEEHVRSLSQWVAQGARVDGTIMFTFSGAISYWRVVPIEVEMFMTIIWMIVSAVGVFVGERWVSKWKEGDQLVNSDKYY